MHMLSKAPLRIPSIKFVMTLLYFRLEVLEDGSPRFAPVSYLTWQQIASFWSRESRRRTYSELSASSSAHEPDDYTELMDIDEYISFEGAIVDEEIIDNVASLGLGDT